MESKEYKDLGEGFIWTCSWCHPGESIFALYPELRGKTVSHGICPAHRTQFMRELDSIAHLGQKPAR